MSTTEDDGNSSPMLPSESPGSSVSASLQDEYQELLKYAVITPHFDPLQLPQTLAEAANAFSTAPNRDPLIFEDASVTGTETSGETDESTTPDEQQRRSMSVMATLGSSTEEQIDTSDVTENDEDLPRSNVPVQMTPIHRSYNGISMPTQLETPDSDKSGVSEADTSTATTTSGMQSPGVVDQDIAHMEAQLDNWSLELKRNVLAEFSQSKISLIERHRQEIRRIKDRHSREVSQLQNDIENLKELLHTYELSIERKDDVISNLTRAVQKQKERFEMLKRFQAWKLKHNEEKRELFTSHLAAKHYERRRMTKVWTAWHSIIEAKWKQRVEKACQSKAQEVCMHLTNDYETRIASLNEALESSRAEVNRLHAEREHYEETMKKAFMRGVCALNLEAMQIFHENEDAEGGTEEGGGGGEGRGGGGGMQPSSSGQYPQHSSTHTASSSIPRVTTSSSMPRTVTSQSAFTPGTISQGASGVRKTSASTKTTQSHKAPKTITAKVSARPEHGQRLGQSTLTGGVQSGTTLAPPMSSVIVERHHPITQQTIGHAMASRYPQQQQRPGQPIYNRTTSAAGISQRRLAGQSGKIPLTASNVHTVKVVH
ncbi:centrosomal protein POC5-like [Amphiura filiformis]|uniref:centrosomal protein POC5-like n=1 Tax=Amphiura filiformis TaxID=82378 RepID=UPI003B21C91B